MDVRSQLHQMSLYLCFFLFSCMCITKALLHFIYKDTLVEDEELSVSSSSCMSTISDTLVAKLLAAADKYNLPRLRLMCESVLCKDISVNSVAKILALADHYHAMDLKSVCLKFAAENLVGMYLFDFPSSRSLFHISQFGRCCLLLCRVQNQSLVD